jgi:xanthine dehydrogenase YagS FAD-binding subunit
MKPFDHVQAGSIEEAISLLKHYGGNARLIAGGTDLLGVLKDRILPDYPAALINIKSIPAMDGIEETQVGLRIGALAKLADIASSPLIKEKFEALSGAAEAVASPEIRNMATIGGNLCQDVRCWYYRYPDSMGGRMLCLRKGSGPCHAVKGDNRYHAILGAKGCFAVCPSDTAVALCALRAEIQIAGQAGKRTLPVEAFFTPLGNALGTGEMVTGIEIPALSADCRQAFLKFTERRPIDFAVASVASVITVHEGKCVTARICLGGVAPAPHRAETAGRVIEGKPLDAASVEDAARASVAGAKTLSGNAYKVEIVRTLVKRALLPAAALQQTLPGT